MKIERSEINCADCDAVDWESYPITGHQCENYGCENEATVALTAEDTEVFLYCVRHADLAEPILAEIP